MNTRINSILGIDEQDPAPTRRNTVKSPIPSEQAVIVRNGRKVGRRVFMRSLAVGGASLLPVDSLFADRGDNGNRLGTITDGDAAILRFLAAAEILETDLWQQYTEFADLGGPYSDALANIDDNMTPYIEQNTVDEFSHQNFLNAFLVKMHRQPVNLDRF